jgi:hypothetical protein
MPALNVRVSQGVYSPCSMGMRSPSIANVALPAPRSVRVNGIFVAPAPSRSQFSGPTTSP